MRDYDRRDSGPRPPQRGYRDDRGYPGGYGREPRQVGREYDRPGYRDGYGDRRRDGYYGDRRPPRYPRYGSPRGNMPGYGGRSVRPVRSGYDMQGSRYRQEAYRRQPEPYDDYDDYEGGSHTGLIVFFVMLILLAAASCIAVVKVNNVFKLVDYIAPEGVPQSAYEISSSDLMAWLPDDGMSGEPVAVSDTDALMNELLSEKCPNSKLRSADAVTNILIIEGESKDSPADVFTLVTINEAQSLVTFVTVMPETMIAFEGMDAPVRLACTPILHGPEAAVEAVESLLGIRIDGCYFINDTGFSAVCDAIGTVPINVSEEQLSAINGRIEQNEGGSFVISSAKAELDGNHTLFFSRYAGAPNDNRISERRAAALYHIACSLKQASLKELATVFKNTAEECSTDMTRKELTSLAMKYRKLRSYDVITDVVPSDAEYTPVSIDGRTMLRVKNIESCRSRIYKGAFEGAYRK